MCVHRACCDVGPRLRHVVCAIIHEEKRLHSGEGRASVFDGWLYPEKLSGTSRRMSFHSATD
jgi:hypothetical protein